MRHTGERSVPELLHVVRLLQQAQLFKGLAPLDLTTVAQAAHFREIERGKQFFAQGHSADVLYVLQRGQVKLTQTTATGEQVLLRFIGSGETFGHAAALLDDQVFSTSAQAVRWSKALAWKRATMVRLMQEHPRIALNALSEISARLQELRNRYRELATERVERRVARALLRLSGQVGYKTDDRVLIDMPLSRQDIAEMTGTTLFTVSRILRLWERKGLVDPGRQRVAILEFPRLLAIAEDLPEKARLRASR